ncbi:MAG: DAK2 domain-containing protein [Acidimicrobiales bacterium]|nr:DAK2 domain-containing protein [Acidimicrobiales bacterium]
MGTIAVMALETLDSKSLANLMYCFSDALQGHKESLNSLNVYPVPDGDTGSNMAATLSSVVSEINSLEENPVLENIIEAISHGSLMGARGNSGVIISQILRGFVSEIKSASKKDIDATLFSRALSAAASAAYEAVGNPVEGTILTVVRETAEATEKAVSEEHALLQVAEIAREAAKRSLDSTPELLPVLARAGVVDAGGSGFLLMLDSLLHIIDDRLMPEPEVVTVSADSLILDTHDDMSNSGTRYEVMYFLEAPDDSMPDFKKAWSEIGDSIVVVGGENIWNCHVHTNNIGAAVEAGISVGKPYDIRVTDLFEEVAENHHDHDIADPVGCSVIAVANGDGIGQIFRSLGATLIVSGGQSMNPSTADLLKAVEATASEHVIILPNNSNIVAVAEQVDSQTSKTVRVVGTHTVTEGFASLLGYDPEATSEKNQTGMFQASQMVESGEITTAVRESKSEIGEIKKGDFLGLQKGKVTVIAETIVEAAKNLLNEMIDDEHEIVTLVAGEDSNEKETDQIVAWVCAEHEELEVEVHEGGQPLYHYYIGIE